MIKRTNVTKRKATDSMYSATVDSLRKMYPTESITQEPDGTFVISRKKLPEALSKTSNTESEKDDPTFKPNENEEDDDEVESVDNETTR